MEKKRKKSPEKGATPINITAVKELAEILENGSLSDIEYETTACRIRVSKSSGQGFSGNFSSMPYVHNVAQPHLQIPSLEKSSVDPQPACHDNLSGHPGAIKSPMVGTVYVAAKPGDPAFVCVGSDVKKGETLAIIEAMKVMNPLKATRSGKVTHIFAEDAHPVEFDQLLFVIE